MSPTVEPASGTVIVALERVVDEVRAAQRVAASSAAARLALQRAREIAGLAPFVLSFDERGAPIEVDGWHVSLAHTRELALAALSRSKVGIDLERFDAPRIARLTRVFGEEELARLVSRDALELAKLWTAKEAVLKLAGVGLLELSLVELESIERDGAFVLRHGELRRRVVHDVRDEHVIALCVDHAAPTISGAFDVQREHARS